MLNRYRSFGEATYPNGSVYVGEWSAGQRCGYGEFSTAEGDAYVGEWLADQLHGERRGGEDTVPAVEMWERGPFLGFIMSLH